MSTSRETPCICNPGACAELYIHIRDTSPDSIVRLSGIRVF